MNVDAIKKEFLEKYGEKAIFLNEINGSVTEMGCETEPSSEHPEYSRAIAVIDRSLPHYHKLLTEKYRILKGTLVLHLAGEKIELTEGSEYTISPNIIHWAEGNETWVEVSSNPGWTIADHIISLQTKFILHGGEAQKPDSRNDEFFREILKDAPVNPIILLVHFAGKPEKAQVNFDRDTSQFNRVRGERDLSFTVATEADFIEQIKASDIIYIGGGTTVKLLPELRKFPNLGELFTGKIVAGESAGANALSSFCYSKSAGGVMEGLGLLPIKFMPHFQGGDLSELTAVDPDLETVTLAEFEYQAFTK